jgi:hypothetical protein
MYHDERMYVSSKEWRYDRVTNAQKSSEVHNITATGFRLGYSYIRQQSVENVFFMNNVPVVTCWTYRWKQILQLVQ